MNEQDEKILKLYMQDIKKKKIFCIISIIFFLICISFFSYTKYHLFNQIDNSIQEENEINIINENITNQTTTSNSVENTVIKQKQKDEIPKEETQKEEKKEETSKQETPQKNIQTTTSKENKTTSQKPSNKDFLFTDGYTMENVTQAAQDYLKSYSYSGECIPLKDNEGVYLGMRVIFY